MHRNSRSLLYYWAIRELNQSMTAMGPRLGISTATVSKSIKRGAEFANENRYNILFWHWKRAEIAAQEYATRQRVFHAALASAPPADFLGAFSVSITRAPWAADGGDAFEDWYLVRDFGALGRLNEAAVSGSRTMPHNAAAAVAAGGAGGLYRLQRGVVLRHPRYAQWFGKPDGMTYNDLSAQLAPMVDQVQGALWIRQMVLGPAREFCLHTATTVFLPAKGLKA